MKKRLVFGGSAALVFAGLLVFWRLLILVFAIPSYLLPTPLAVVQVAMQRLPELCSSLMISAEAAIGGLIVTITVHCPIGNSTRSGRMLLAIDAETVSTGSFIT